MRELSTLHSSIIQENQCGKGSRLFYSTTHFHLPQHLELWLYFMSISGLEYHKTSCLYSFGRRLLGESWSFQRLFFPCEGHMSVDSEKQSQQSQIKIKKWGLRPEQAERWANHHPLAEFMPGIKGLVTVKQMSPGRKTAVGTEVTQETQAVLIIWPWKMTLTNLGINCWVFLAVQHRGLRLLFLCFLSN